jgi:hypothetical protein
LTFEQWLGLCLSVALKHEEPVLRGVASRVSASSVPNA